MNIIEYFYSAHSAFAYIGHQKLLDIREAHGCELVHRPIALSPVVEAVRGLPFDARTQHHVDYFFGREIERWAEIREVEILRHRPTHHDNSLNLSNGLLIVAIQRGVDIDALSLAVLRAHWLHDIDLNDADQLKQVAASVSSDYAEYVDEAMGEAAQEQHLKNTNEAIKRGVFGSPTFFLNGDMFYGQDHLELIERALRTPFKPNRFKNPIPGQPRG